MTLSSSPSAGKRISLEQLIALNDEIKSLARAGMPLERGLKLIAEDQRDRLGEISETLSLRMSRGESLTDALKAEGDRFPTVYRVVVEAGMRAGRLPAALESLSSFAGELVDLRRKIGEALVYPVIVIFLAYSLFVVFVLELVERLQAMYWTLRIPVQGLLQFLGLLGDTVRLWWWILPLCGFVAVFWWFFTANANLLSLGGSTRPLRWIPGFGRIIANYQYASFSRLLGLLVEHEVGLPQGIVLAAEATGDARMRRSAHAVASAVEDGGSLSDETFDAEAFPPLLRWLMGRGEDLGRLPQALQTAADMYRRRAGTQTEWFKLTFPVLAGVGIGGTVTLLYVLSVFVPFVDLLKALAME